MHVHANAKTTLQLRLELVRRVQAGEPVQEGARAIGLSETTVRKWLRRLDEEGPSGVLMTENPKRSPSGSRGPPDSASARPEEPVAPYSWGLSTPLGTRKRRALGHFRVDCRAVDALRAILARPRGGPLRGDHVDG